MPKKIPSRLSIECGVDIRAAKDDKDAPTFTMKAYSGAVMNLAGFYDPVVVELSGIKAAAKSLPILNGHNPDRIVGHSTGVTVSAKDVQVSGVISGVGFYADEVVKSAGNGFPWQASIGASIEKGIYLEEGETTSVNGKVVKGPMVIAKKTVLKEVSFVPLGADSNTSANVAAECTQLGVCTMKFEEFVASLGLELDKLSDDQKEALQAKFDAGVSVEAAAKSIKKTPVKVPETPPVQAKEKDDEDPLKARRELLAADTERVNQIGVIAAQEDFADVKEMPELQAKAIREGWNTDKFELECRRVARPTPQSFSHSAPSDDERKTESKVLECAIARQCGNFNESQLTKWYGEDALEASDKSRYHGAGVHMLFDRTIEATGQRYTGSRKSNDFIRAAFRADRDIRANEGFSTLSVSQILENVAHKQLIAGYESVGVAWPLFCAQHSMSDFKPHNRYRLDSSGSFRQVPSSGEIKHVSLSDDKYTKQLDTYGAILALNRQQMINDDLNAFMEIPSMLGRMAAIRIEEAVFMLLLSNPGDFFGVGNGNLTDAVFGIPGLNTLEQIFLNQIDPNGKPVLIAPKVLLVPTTLKVDADNVYANTTVDQMLTGDEIARNPHKGKYPPAVSPYLNNTAITDENGNALAGQSDTGYYLFADPAVRAAIAVGLLNGSRVPILESADTDFNTLGMQWRAYHDFGVGLEDPKAGAFSSGDAA